MKEAHEARQSGLISEAVRSDLDPKKIARQAVKVVGRTFASLGLALSAFAADGMINPSESKAQVVDCEAFGFTMGGVPEAAGDKLVPLSLATGNENIVVVVAGPLGYTDPSGRRVETEGRSKGRSKATLFVKPGVSDPVDVLVFPRGNWVGVPLAMGRDWSDPNTLERFADCMANKVRRDNGVTDDIDYIQLGTDNGIVVHSVYQPGGNVVSLLGGARPTEQEPAVPPASVSAPAGTVDIDFSDPNCRPGRVYKVPPKTIVIGDTNNNGEPAMDGRSETGLISYFRDGGTISCPFGAGVIDVSGLDDNQIEVLISDLRKVMEKTGCVGGCSGGVTVVRP